MPVAQCAICNNQFVAKTKRNKRCPKCINRCVTCKEISSRGQATCDKCRWEIKRHKPAFCRQCGQEFAKNGDADRCEKCRMYCAECGKPKAHQGNYCYKCKRNKSKNETRKCNHAGCENKLGQNNQTGFCKKHAYTRNEKRRNEHHNKWAGKTQAEKDKIRDIECVCAVCGKPFLATRGTIKKSQRTKTAHVCSGNCRGIIAAQSVPFFDTSIERAIENELKARKINYQKQVPLCSVTIVDFYLPEYKLVIYCDGKYWHSSEQSKKRDRKQNDILINAGYTVYRFDEKRINKSPAECIESIVVIGAT